jgi:hypothetical protein
MSKNKHNADKTVPKQLEPYAFKPGESGNPAGRPVGSVSIMGRIKTLFAENPELFAGYIADIVADKNMRKEVLQQIDGKPVQPISGVDGNPIVLQIVKYGEAPKENGNNITPVSTETIPDTAA